MPLRRLTLIVSCQLLVGLAAGLVWAQDDIGERLPTHGDWQAFVVGDGATRQCVAVTWPKAVEPEGLNRGTIALLVSHQLDNQEFSVLQVKMGYPLDPDVPIKINIDGDRWELFGDGQNAWPWDLDDNDAIIQAMKAGLEMYVEGRSQRGNTTMDR